MACVCCIMFGAPLGRRDDYDYWPESSHTQPVFLMCSSLRLQVQVSQQTRWRPYHFSWPGFIRHEFHFFHIPSLMKQLQVHLVAGGRNMDPNSEWEECQGICSHLKTAVKRQWLTNLGSQGRLHRRGGIERRMEICWETWRGWEVILQRKQHLSGLHIQGTKKQKRTHEGWLWSGSGIKRKSVSLLSDTLNTSTCLSL